MSRTGGVRKKIRRSRHFAFVAARFPGLPTPFAREWDAHNRRRAHGDFREEGQARSSTDREWKTNEVAPSASRERWSKLRCEVECARGRLASAANAGARGRRKRC